MEPRNFHKFLIVGVSLLVVGASFVLGIGVGYANRPAVEKVTDVFNKETAKPASVDFNPFWDVWQRIKANYVDKGTIDQPKLVQGAISGMVKALGDPYTIYLPPEEAKQFSQDIKGSFGGIGAELGLLKGIITVIAPLKNSPAEHAGIKAGDSILRIDGKDTNDLTVDGAVHLIRGEKGTQVKLLIYRPSFSQPKEISITRDTIVVPNITTKNLGNGIFYVQLSEFTETSPDDFRRAVNEFQSSGDSKIILDLRNNPGGYLSAAVEIASYFVPTGDVVVTEKYGNGQPSDVYRSRGYRILQTTPVAVLVNQGSASASEILAGALHDNRAAKLIGEKTFGKGSVQELQNLDGGASLKVTIAKWYTPSDHSINGTGLLPDITVEATTTPVVLTQDPVVQKGIETLK
ncbi:MAG: S41 family peptidase [Candidatus Sungbacteria bacterium]|uniref:S41 family peptidase n=1 Tax=Candidatus Sungiibacteriota bacterium TaxID=2750080 RepID=A0A9D6LNW3_9BACT|nr:S41 family peptidase [Candidatus Sungbacteria bacterium]